MTVILAGLFLRVVVWEMMYWAAHSSWGVSSAVTTLSGGRCGFGARCFCWDLACGATLVSTRYCGLRAFRPPAWMAAAVAAWRRAVVLVYRVGGLVRGEAVVVLMCPRNGVASLGVAMWGLALGLLDR